MSVRCEPVGLEENQLKRMYVDAAVGSRVVGVAHRVRISAHRHHPFVVAEVDALCRQRGSINTNLYLLGALHEVPWFRKCDTLCGSRHQ